MNITFFTAFLWLCLLTTSSSFPASITLHQAAREGNFSRCKLLITEGCDINREDEEGYTPLHLASQEGHQNICLFLLQKWANVNAENEDGLTPLHKAVWEGHLTICSLLIEYHADVNAKNQYGSTPLHYATCAGHQAICALLIKCFAHVNERDHNGYTPLHVASREACKGICSLLINCSANVDARDNRGYTPLHVASSEGHPDICSLLIKNKANIHEKTKYSGWFFLEGGYTPLQLAIQKNHEKTCELLILYGASLNMDNRQGRKVLQSAKYGKTKNLIRKYADRIKNRETVLHWAAEKGDPELFAFLMKQNITIDPFTNQGKNIFDFANNDKIKNMIRQYETIKIASYLGRLKGSNHMPTVIINLILSFSVGKKKSTQFGYIKQTM